MRFRFWAAWVAAFALLIVALGGDINGSAKAPRIAPAAASGIVQYGVATWYGPGFEGQITACGHLYDSSGFTAASNTLPCGSTITVTNQENGRSVRVTVTDRGAFQYPNIADLSIAAFRTLASTDQGVIPVMITTEG